MQTKEIGERLRSEGIRFTRGRRAVLDALTKAGKPLSAAEVYEELGGSVPLSSVYRSLATLEDAGVLSPHLGNRSLTRYEPSEWLRGHHHHLLCRTCGSVEDIHLPDGLEHRLEELVSEIGVPTGFQATGHALEIEGRCAKCR